MRFDDVLPRCSMPEPDPVRGTVSRLRLLAVAGFIALSPAAGAARSVAFGVKPHDAEDSVYIAKIPPVGAVKQLRLSFSADASPVTGTCRIDYIWAGRLP